MSTLLTAADQRDQARERLLGVILVVLSASIFAGVDGLSKLLADTSSVAQIVWARYALALPILLATTQPSQLPTLFRTRQPGLQILRGLAPVMVSIAMVFGVRYLPLAEATVSSPHRQPARVAVVGPDTAAAWSAADVSQRFGSPASPLSCLAGSPSVDR